MLTMQDISIKHKLILITMLTCIVALLSAAAGFIVWEWTAFRRTMVQNVSTQAEMIAENCKASLAFQVAKDAEETLKALHVEPSIVFGCVYTKDGKFFATYYRDFAETKVHPSKFVENGYSFGEGYLTVFRPIVLDGATIGAVCLRSDMNPMYAMLKNNIFIIIAVLLFASLVAYLVSTRIQRIISSPILSLADVAKVISEKKNYSTRAIKSSNDEVGLLIDAFNEMLEQIQHRDFELVEAKGKLEVRVEERTAELTAANGQLTREVAVRKQAEEALKESEQRLSIVLNSILTGVVVVDAQTHEIIDANPLAVKLIGLPREEIVGKVCHKFICPAEKGKCPISDLCQVVDQSERVLIRGDGKEIPILKTVTPASWQGRSYLVESFIDITRRKQAENRQTQLLKEVESANRELKDFAYVVSHDLKAPLRGIKTLSEWISTDYTDKLDEQGKEQMKLLVGRVDRMQNLIDGILQYSRIGRVKEKRDVVNLNKIVAEIIDILASPANITITVENELPTIECEPTRIVQVFQNLLSNAVKYMDKPQGQIKVGCVEENGFWKFSVADNGPGIEEKHFERIFQLFQTLAPRDSVESTGVGLTVAKKVVELYGGRIWIESKIGEGSTFFFTLPKQEIGAENAKLEANITC
jgi:two-component system, LuxR family, sensor kinase FixL